MSAGKGAYRQPREPVPMFVLDTDMVDEAARRLAVGVRHQHDLLRRKTEHDLRHYLFIDPQLRVFLIADIHAAADHWLREHYHWLVGAYVPYEPTPNDQRIRRRPALVELAEGLERDIRGHLHAMQCVAG